MWNWKEIKEWIFFQLFSKANWDISRFNNDKDIHQSSELMGIGLAFWHKILQKMDSELKLSSAVNVGSTFNFKYVSFNG